MEMSLYIRRVVERFLEDKSEMFLIGVSVSNDKHIKVILDSDKQVVLRDCMNLSRFIEADINENKDIDFSLEVTSSGLTESLKVRRQYVKNKGEEVEILTREGRLYTGVMSQVEQDYIVLKYSTKEPKPVGKGKVKVEKEQRIEFEEIKNAKLKIIFKSK